jgi:hypothetical protein
MLGLLTLCIAENIVNMRNDIFRNFVKRLAYLVLIYVVLGLVISFPSFSEAAAFQERQGAFKAISINSADAGSDRQWIRALFQESFSDGLSDFVKFLSFVAPKRETVAENDPKAKSNNCDDYTLLQCLLPRVRLLLGF